MMKDCLMVVVSWLLVRRGLEEKFSYLCLLEYPVRWYRLACHPQGKARGGGNYILSILFPRVGNFVNGMLAPLGGQADGGGGDGCLHTGNGAHVSLIGAAPAAPSIPLNFSF